MEIQSKYLQSFNQSANVQLLRSPYDQSAIAEIEVTDQMTAMGWLKEAEAFYKNQREWISAESRAAILNRVANQIEAETEFFTKLIAREGGKPYKDAAIEVGRACLTLRLCAAEAVASHGTEIPMRASAAASGHLAITTREPIGVVFAISAFNHPLNLIAHQVGSAIAAGCPVIVKPAHETPLSCIHLVNLLREAGMPKESVRWIYCQNETAQAIAESPMISFLSFIGSAKVGWHLRSSVAPGTRVALEHGGAAPVIIDETANLDEILPAVVKGAFYHAGQVCVSIQRVYIHDSRKEEFLGKFKTAVQLLKTGDALDPETDCGPIIRARDVSRIMDWIEESVRMGAKTLCGGKKISASLIEPTVLVEVPHDAKVMKEEVFGPVVCVNSYANFDDVIQAANSVPFIFQASLFTTNLDRAMQASRSLKATTVLINESTTYRTDWMPFAGGGVSGLGVGGVPYEVHEMTREKMTVIKSKHWAL